MMQLLPHWPLLLSTEEAFWLQQEAPEVICWVEASWFMPSQARNAQKEYEEEGHIPGAVFFDIEEIKDKASPLPHMLPSAAVFSKAVGALGISRNCKIIIYDRHPGGLFSAARAWWMFKVFGHEHVALLDGGLQRWQKRKKPLEKGKILQEPTVYQADYQPALVRNRIQMLENCTSGQEQVIDARSAVRFTGLEPEPRPGLLRGHIPQSINLPFQKLLQPNGCLLPKEALLTLFQSQHIDLHRPIITSCGSGVTAAIVLFALYYAGATSLALYDGSAAEWLDPEYQHPILCGESVE